jgi:hypothetical protein
MKRREFLMAGALGLLGGAAFTLPWRSGELGGTLQRPGLELGHALRDGGLAATALKREKVPVVIVGGGISGLSAAYYLSQAGYHDYLLLETEERPGGNAAWGENAVTRYPWGAHYLPLPSKESMHVRRLLQEFGILLEGVDSEQPKYDERLLVHAPDERVFDGTAWHEGILPEAGMAPWEKDENRRFYETMAQFRAAYGADGRKAFAIPAALSSQDPAFRQLDRLTMGEWLGANSFKGARLRWYLNYCCRDDFGTGVDQVSAWAGIHYFAARAGRGPSEEGAYLTWPEGLGRLAMELSQRVQGRRERAFVYRLNDHPGGIEAVAYFPDSGEHRTLLAERIIWAAPAHVAQHAISEELMPERRQLEVPSAPWVVANLQLRDWPRYTPGVPLAWDNVIMAGRGLGYVVATHQEIAQATHGPTVFTCYDAWSQGGDFARNRKLLEKASWSELAARFLADLRPAHPDIDRIATRMDIHIWGHAMASPGRGFLSHPARKLTALHGKVLFTHSDAAGYSVFEEASWLGLQAARKVLRG